MPLERYCWPHDMASKMEIQTLLRVYIDWCPTLEEKCAAFDRIAAQIQLGREDWEKKREVWIDEPSINKCRSFLKTFWETLPQEVKAQFYCGYFVIGVNYLLVTGRQLLEQLPQEASAEVTGIRRESIERVLEALAFRTLFAEGTPPPALVDTQRQIELDEER